MENNFPVGTIINATEVSALRILFPDATFTPMQHDDGYLGFTSSAARSTLIWQTLSHRNSVLCPILNPDKHFPVIAEPVALPTCTDCGAPDAIHYANNAPRCPACTKASNRRDVAYSQLLDLLTRAAQPWAQHWITELTRDDLAQLVEDVIKTISTSAARRKFINVALKKKAA